MHYIYVCVYIYIYIYIYVWYVYVYIYVCAYVVNMHILHLLSVCTYVSYGS